MNFKIITFFLISFVLYISCNKTPTQIELKEDFTEDEFCTALIGKWQSVYKEPNSENIVYLEFNNWFEWATIIIEAVDGTQVEYNGNYSVSFLYCSPGSVTVAEITIITSKEIIILSNVNFTWHSSLPYEEGPFLRILEEPFGTLKRIS